MNQSKDLKLSNIDIRYSDGSGVKVVPYRMTKDDHGYDIPKDQQRTDFGLTYYNKRGETTEYEGSWKTRQLVDWIAEVIEFENVDLDKEFDEIMKRYPTSQ